MYGSTLKRMKEMLFVPSVKESLLIMAELLICATTCKEAMLPFAHDSEQPKIDSLIKVKKCSPAQARMIVGMTVHDLRPA